MSTRQPQILCAQCSKEMEYTQLPTNLRRLLDGGFYLRR
jgi:hypothetical protein